MEGDLSEQATQLNTREEYVAWEQRCDEFIESLKEQSRIKRPRLSIGNRQSVIACIARLESLKGSVRGRFVHVGAGHGLRWRTIETAFESRILTGAVINSNYIELRRFLEDASETVLERVQCIMQRYINLAVNANKLNPLRAGCHIKLPREIMLKRAVINVQSTDNACFAWSVIAALHQGNAHRTSSYPHYSSVLNLQDIQFPMTLSQIKKFEALNDISINVYAIEKGIVPIRLTDRKRSKHVNLLYVEDDSAGHFALIKDLSRLVSSQINRYGHRKYFCDRCLHYFDSSAKLEIHTEDCGKLNDCAIRLPSEDDKWLSFHNHCRKERVPFVVYADLEDYTVDNAYGFLANKKVPGFMKDENNGAVMTEFVGLRAKMYASRVEGKKDAKKAKDVKSSVVAKSITFEDYPCCLNDAIEMTRRQPCIRSKLHEVYTISETKIALSPHDDKRYIVSGSTDTLPWGHYRCK
ncbi:hypothetical protein ALC57_17078 [Trachymyrmex cornetzi]|uniref:C2H2-type domain-containing protein n=1 Tax=Trachymyrmex cornetzi TaxID=471704 RepID=A0A151ITU7_9HYME|nr:hypothetical protein ALC57_17078 [Trachymyrmex cornetzi]